MAHILLLQSRVYDMSGLAPGERYVTEGGEALPIDSALRETSACKGDDVLGVDASGSFR